MHELLTAFLILFITAIMIGVIYFIFKTDKKIAEINDQVSEFKNIDFMNLRKVVSILHNVNKVSFGKIKYYFEIVLTAITTTKFFLLIKKLNQKYKD